MKKKEFCVRLPDMLMRFVDPAFRTIDTVISYLASSGNGSTLTFIIVTRGSNREIPLNMVSPINNPVLSSTASPINCVRFNPNVGDSGYCPGLVLKRLNSEFFIAAISVSTATSLADVFDEYAPPLVAYCGVISRRKSVNIAGAVVLIFGAVPNCVKTFT